MVNKNIFMTEPQDVFIYYMKTGQKQIFLFSVFTYTNTETTTVEHLTTVLLKILFRLFAFTTSERKSERERARES